MSAPTAGVAPTDLDDLLVATLLARILHADPVGPERRRIARELRRQAARHPSHAGSLQRCAYKLTRRTS